MKTFSSKNSYLFDLFHHYRQATSEEEAQDDNKKDDQPSSLNSESGTNSDEGVGEDLNPQENFVEEQKQYEGGIKEEGAGGQNYEVYYYDAKESSSGKSNDANAGKSDKPDIFKNLRTSIDDPFEVLFMRAEGIYAHGYHSHACKMAIALAQDMLRSPPNLTMAAAPHPIVVTTPQSENPNGAKGKKKRVSAASHALTHMASTTLSHCAFLCTVLSEVVEHHSLAFQVGMFGIEMARPPASTKPMEVKLAHQESELVGLLKKIPLGHRELAILRERATYLQDGTLRIRGDALLPLMLASYIFDSLVTSNSPLLNKGDEQLGFEACVAAIGLKANVSEAEHPLLCEGTRRQRGDLALSLLVHYKDHPERLAKVMEKLLDKEIHQLLKCPIQTSYYVQQPQRSISAAFRNMNLNGHQQQQQQQAVQQQQPMNDRYDYRCHTQLTY